MYTGNAIVIITEIKIFGVKNFQTSKNDKTTDESASKLEPK